MKIKYKGCMCNLSITNLIKAPMKTKKIFLSEQFEYKKNQLKDYWIGYVDVEQEMIYCFSDIKLYKIRISAGRKNSGQIFSSLMKDDCKQIINACELNNKNFFELFLDLGCGMSQSYTFTKKQKNMLISKLKPLLDIEWYDEE